MIPTKTVVWHEPSDKYFVVDDVSQVGDIISKVLGKAPESSIEVIPKEFHVMSHIPYHAMGGM